GACDGLRWKMEATITPNLIAGEWIASSEGIESRNPSDTTDLIGSFAQATEAHLDLALSRAVEAQRIWAERGLEQRAAVLNAIGQELMTRSEELGTLLSREEGKPLAEGIGEVYRSGQF